MPILLSESKVAELHNNRGVLIPYNKLSSRGKKSVYNFWLHEGIRRKGKRVSAMQNLFEVLNSDEAPYADVDLSRFMRPGHTPEEEDPGEEDIENEPIEREPSRRRAEPDPDEGDLNALARRLYPDIVRGDKRALNKLLNAFRPYLTALARKELYHAPEYVDEAVNDTLQFFADKVGEWTLEGPSGGTMTYFKYILRNKCMNIQDFQMRRKGQWHKDDATGEEYWTPNATIEDEFQGEDGEGDVSYARGIAVDTDLTPDVKTQRNEAFERLNDFINTKLPENERNALKAFAFEGLSEKETAAKYGWTVSRVKTYKENARFYIKEWMKNDPEMASLLRMFTESVEVQDILLTVRSLAEQCNQGKMCDHFKKGQSLSRGKKKYTAKKDTEGTPEANPEDWEESEDPSYISESSLLSSLNALLK